MEKRILILMKKYYIALLLFAFSTIEMMIIIKKDYYGIHIENSNIKLLLTLIFGAIISLVIKSIICRVDKKIKRANLFYLFIPILMVLVYFVVLNDINITSQLFKYPIFCFLSCILFLIIPFLGKEEDSDYYSYRVIISLILTGLCYLLLILGIFFTIRSISILFEIVIKDYIYIEIAVFILGFIMPTLFLSGIPSIELKREQYPNFVKKIFMYIVFPILSVYTVILYIYFIKILLELKMPSNILGDLVIYYSLISIVVLYFTNKINDNKWSNNFIKIYPYMLIIPMIIMLISFIIRINQYGFTEARYYALLCFAFVMISIFIIKKNNKVKYIPLTLSILLLISIFGPVSAINVSKLSQEKKLEIILVDNNMLKDNKIIKNANLSEEEKKEIYNILIYFEERHSFKDIDLLPKTFDINNMKETFGFDYNNKN